MQRNQMLDILSDISVFKIYEYADKIGGSISLTGIVDMFPIGSSETFISHSVERGIKAKHILVFRGIEGAFYKISDDGIEYVQSQMTQPRSNITLFIEHGDQWLDEEIDQMAENPPDDNSENSANSKHNEPPKFSKFRDRLIIQLANKEQSEGPGKYDLGKLAEDAKLTFQEGWVSKAAYYFKDHGLVNDAFTI